jgi:hypothetical protein
MSLAPLKFSPAKSAASQPLVTGSRGGARLRSTGITGPVTEPVPEPVKTPVSYVAATGVSWRSVAGGKNVNGNSSSSTFQPAAVSVSTT